MDNNKLLYVIDYPTDALYNFNLAKEYEDIGQLSSAISFYLRSAEFSYNELLSYESLLRISLCLEKQGNRVYTLKGILLRAISLLPKRAEAYFILSRISEYNKEWHECYTFASIGETLITNSDEKLITDVGYPGHYGFIFEKAVSAWWIGLYDESIHLLRMLNNRIDILPIYSNSIKNNLNNLGRSYKRPTKYDKSLYNKLRYKFNGSDNIDCNYSQCYQDMFVLTMLNGKRKGKFLEIGCDDAYFNSNTALLEKEFGWIGISIDIDKNKINKFKQKRSSETICMDALKIDFKTLLKDEIYDYLQIDCEPASTSFRVLQRIPFETCMFAVITFEHDNYCDEDKSIKEKARKYLQSYGYKIIVNNISEDKYSDFEDWFVHPDLVNNIIIEKMLCISDDTKKCDDYFLQRI